MSSSESVFPPWTLVYWNLNSSFEIFNKYYDQLVLNKYKSENRNRTLEMNELYVNDQKSLV